MPIRTAKSALCAVILLLTFGNFSGFAQALSDHYALILEDSPVVERFASREALRTTAAESYRQQIETRQQSLRSDLASRNISITGSVSTLLNAVFVVAPPDRADELKTLSGVRQVVRLRRLRPFLNKATQVVNAPAAWTALNGLPNAGAGMKIGVLDYGIDQTHAAFQDKSLPLPTGYPICTTGHPEDCAFTNNKVIVARSYTRMDAAGSNPANVAADSIPDDYSPRDRDGHGTEIASAAAGGNATGTLTINGMAPKAYLGNYKIAGSPFVNDAPTEDVYIQALSDAQKDGMDVVNLSWGYPAVTGPLDTGAACGLAAGQMCNPLAQAFENAAKAGIVVVLAAGNQGSDGSQYPTFNSIGTPADAPSVIAAGAVWNTHSFNPGVDISGGPSALQNIPGAYTDAAGPYGAATAPLIDVSTIGDGYACSAMPAVSLYGAFALVQRSPVGSSTACSFLTKVTNVTQAGAVGVIFYMSDSSALIYPSGLGSFSIPIVMIAQSDGTAVKSYLAAHAGAQATIDPAVVELPADFPNQLAYFSSFGPSAGSAANLAGQNLIKPDLVAPGAYIYMATQTYDPNGGGYSTTGYVADFGTSFASPLVAGAAALVKQKHPGYTPGQIKSALVNTANTTNVTVDDSGDLVNVQWLGAGELDAGAAVNTSVTLQVLDVPAPASPPLATALNFGIVTALPATKQILITNSGASSVTLAVAVVQSTVLQGATPIPAGTTLTTDKTSVTVAAGGTGSVNVVLGGSVPAAGSYVGTVTLAGSGTSLQVPYMFLVGDGNPYDFIPLYVDYGTISAGYAVFEGAFGQNIGPISFRVIDQYGVPVANSPVAFTPRGVTLNNASTKTDQYGVLSADIILGTTASPSVVVGAAGQRVTVNGYARPQPNIASGGVVDAANGVSPVAAGSYVSIYGTGMVDSFYFPNTLGQSGDSATTPILPLNIDGVTVSWDYPSGYDGTPAHYNGAPGFLTYVSPGQINLQVPWEMQGKSSAQVKVTIDGISPGNVVTVPMATYAPAFFLNSGTVADALDYPNYHLITLANPAKRGAVIQLYVNGLGPVSNQPASGTPALASPLSQTPQNPIVSIGGQPAQVVFSGLAPGYPGLYQVNVVVAANTPTGSQPITISIGGVTSPATVGGRQVILPVQ